MPINEIHIENWMTNWRLRFGDFLAVSKLEFAPNIEDAICYAAEIRPAQLLKLHLDKMSLIAWSELLLLSLMDREANGQYNTVTPRWMAIPALIQLGLPTVLSHFQGQHMTAESQESFSLNVAYEQDEALIDAWLSKIEPDRLPSNRKIGLILVNQKGSKIEDWTPSSRYGAFVLNNDMLTKYGPALNKLLTYILHDTPISVVLNELDESLSNRADLISQLSLPQPVPIVNLVAQNAAEINSNYPTIRGPQDLDDAMTKALNLIDLEDRKKAQ